MCSASLDPGELPWVEQGLPTGYFRIRIMYYHGIDGYHQVFFGQDEEVRSEARWSRDAGLCARLEKGRLDAIQGGRHEEAKGGIARKIGGTWGTIGGCEFVREAGFFVLSYRKLT